MSRPFDEARYTGLLEGLEVSEIYLSKLENVGTIGAEYYAPEFLRPYERLTKSAFAKRSLKSICSLITDGDHGSADYAEEGVTFILSEAVKVGWIDNEACRCITAEHAATLQRSSLRAGDVLVSKTGVYFGHSAVVTADFTGANTIAHVGVLRLKSGENPYFVSMFLNSAYGYTQLRRRGIKATRPEIKLLEFADIAVPKVSDEFSQAIQDVALKAESVRVHAKESVFRAEQLLLASLGLASWQAPEPLTYTRSSRDAFSAGRLDSEYFAPRVSQLLARLSRDGLSIGDVAPVRRRRFVPGSTGSFNYIEIGGVRADGTAVAEPVEHAEAPSRASQLVEAGDVITSTVRPIRRLSALIAPEQHESVCSSGFVVLQPKNIAAEVLLTYLRLQPVCELMDLHTSASLYPAISETDLLALPIPRIAEDAQLAVTKAVKAAQAARQQAAQLLEAAKRAVEIAIEDSEAAALQWLAVQTAKIQLDTP